MNMEWLLECFLKMIHTSYMLLPGPPHELQPMFRKYGASSNHRANWRYQEKIESRVLRYFGIGEAELRLTLMI